MTRNLELARRFIQDLEAGGATSIEDALAKVLSYAGTVGRLRQVVFATDGQPTVGELGTETLVKKRAEGEDWFTYDAPAAMLFHHGQMTDGADVHIAATYAMLAAESLGLGSCMLGTTAGLNHAKSFKEKYGIPPKNKIGLGLVLGYPEKKYLSGVRRRLASVKFA